MVLLESQMWALLSIGWTPFRADFYGWRSIFMLLISEKCIYFQSQETNVPGPNDMKSAGLVCIFLSHLCIDKVKSFLKRNLNMLTNLRAWGCRYLYIDYRRGNLGFKKHHYAHMWSPAFLSTNLGNAISNALFLGGLHLKWPSGTELKLNEGNHFLRFKGFLWGSLVLSLSLLYG